jgi:hypothetical protein
MEFKKTYIILDEVDAKTFIASKVNLKNIISFSPNAYHHLRNTNNTIIRSSELFDNNQHQHIAKEINKIENKIFPVIENEKKLSRIAKEIYFNDIHAALSTCYRIWEILPESESYFVRKGSKFLEIKNKNDAFLFLIKRLQDQIPLSINIRNSSFSTIINSINSFILKALSAKNVFIFASFNYGFPWISRAIMDKEENTIFISFSPTERRIKDLMILFVSIYSFITNKKIIKLIIPPDSFQRKKTVVAFLKLIDINHISKGLGIFMENIGINADMGDSLANKVDEVYREIEPKAIIVHQVRSPMALAIVDAANRNDITSYLASHGTHLTSNNDVCNLEQRSLARGLLASHLVEYNIVQSDLAKEAMTSFFPNLQYLEFENINWGFSSNFSKISRNQKVKILHASTYKALTTFRPWIFESSDEFHKSLTELIITMKEINDAELIIRHREIGEMSIDTYINYIDKQSSVTIKTDQDSPFIEDLEQADIVIACFSTTIEEAINIGKYVILWGGGYRYSHINNKLLNEKLIYPVYSVEELYNTIKLLIDILASKPEENFKRQLQIKDSQSKFIERLMSK